MGGGGDGGGRWLKLHISGGPDCDGAPNITRFWRSDKKKNFSYYRLAGSLAYSQP